MTVELLTPWVNGPSFRVRHRAHGAERIELNKPFIDAICLALCANLPKIFFWKIQTFNEVLIEVEAGGELDVLDGVSQIVGLLPICLRQQHH